MRKYIISPIVDENINLGNSIKFKENIPEENWEKFKNGKSLSFYPCYFIHRCLMIHCDKIVWVDGFVVEKHWKLNETNFHKAYKYGVNWYKKQLKEQDNEQTTIRRKN